MMNMLYRLAVSMYFTLIRAASLFNPKAGLFFRGRRNLFQHLANQLPVSDAPLVWFHAASLGEFEQGRPVIERLKKQLPHLRILLTFFSPSGFEVRKGYQVADYICYLPVESEENAKRFFDIVRPSIAVFIKYEFWKAYIEEAQRREVTLISISAIFRPTQLFFKSYGGFFRKSLLGFNHFFVQNEESSRLLRSIGIANITVAGDTRFDRVAEIRNLAKKIEIASDFKNGQKLMVMGSVWPDDMEILFPIINSFRNNLKFIVAPHQIDESFLQKIEKNTAVPSIRYSLANDTQLAEKRVLLIDNIGMLSSLYAYGEMAFVGGGFHGGLHNTLEPAAFGIPVIWGEHAKNTRFQEAIGLKQQGGGFSVRTSADLLALVKSMLQNDAALQEAGRAAGGYVNSKTGATNLIVDYLVNKMNK